MRQEVTVLSAGDGMARVSYDRPTACHNDCAHCAGGCGSTVAQERVIVQAADPFGVRAGDRVIIEAETKEVYSAILLVYALPLVLFFAGYFLAEALHLSGVITGVAGFFLGVLCAVLVSRRKTKTGNQIQFRISGYADSGRRPD